LYNEREERSTMKLSANTVKKLGTVKPPLRKVIERAAEITQQPFEIVQGNRTQAEQNALYAQGRTKPGKVVTWTRNSRHIGGGAIDFAALVGNKISWDPKYYPEVAKAIREAAEQLGVGVIWGGNWKTKDWGHIELTGKDVTPAPTTAPVEPIQPPHTAPTSVLQKRSQGDQVKKVQALLAIGLYYKGIIDGDWGNGTDKAVRDFQLANGLKVDGIVSIPDGATWKKLNSDFKKADPTTVPTQPNPDFAVDFFSSLPGWKDFMAVAPVAHAQQESYMELKPDAVGDAGTAFGILQWRGTRKAALDKMGKELNRPWNTLPVQLAFAVHELNTTEKAVRDLLLKSTDVEEATAAFMGFLRPAGFNWANMRKAKTWTERIEIAKKGHGWANRLKNAQALLTKLRQQKAPLPTQGS
jgi:hypothetical protein